MSGGGDLMGDAAESGEIRSAEWYVRAAARIREMASRHRREMDALGGELGMADEDDGGTGPARAETRLLKRLERALFWDLMQASNGGADHGLIGNGGVDGLLLGMDIARLPGLIGEDGWTLAGVGSLMAKAGDPDVQADMLRRRVYDGPFALSLAGRAATLGSLGSVDLRSGISLNSGIFRVRAGADGRYLAGPLPHGLHFVRRVMALIGFLAARARGDRRPPPQHAVDPPDRVPFAGEGPLVDALRPISGGGPEIVWMRPRRSTQVVLHLTHRAAVALRADMACWARRSAEGATMDAPLSWGLGAAGAAAAGGEEVDM